MAFDPDAFLAGDAPSAPAPKGKRAAAFDPDAFLGVAPTTDVGPFREGYKMPAPAPTVPRLPPRAELPENRPTEEKKFSAKPWYSQAADLLLGRSPLQTQKGIDEALTNANAGPGTPTYEAMKEAEVAKHAVAGGFAGGAVGGMVSGALAPAVATAAGRVAAGTIASAAGGAVGAGAETALDRGGFDREALEAMKSGAAGGAVVGGAGAALGTAGGAIRRALAKGAAARQEARLIDNMTLGAPAKLRDKALGEAGIKKPEVLRLANENPELKTSLEGGKTAEALQNTRDIIASKMQVTGAVYDRVAGVDPGLKVSDVIGRIEDIAKGLESKPGTIDLAAEVRRKAENVLTAWGNRTHVTPKEVREFVTDLGPAAFRSAPGVQPGQAERVAQDVYHSLVGAIDDHVDEVAKIHKIPVNSTMLREANKDISTLIAVRDALKYKATREASPPTTLRSNAGKAVQAIVDAGSGVSALASGNPLPLAVPVATRALPAVGRWADRQLAPMATKNSTGDLARALRLGAGFGAQQEARRR